ncbi:MAG: hypothetical protein KDD46_03635 [Bdellovibrionales bacterium]|nr:hypothetical protein [Bdellovibrionales bacterium]
MMKKFVASFVIVVGFFCSTSQADPGDYYLRALAGPSFNVSDFEDQFRLGGEFYYDLGYNMNIGLLTLFGVNQTFRFQLMPGFSYNYLYLGPAVFHALIGAGYGRIDSANTLDFRFSTGVRLPLNERIEAYSDINYFMSPVGTPGNPQTFDWLLGVGFHF